MALSEQHHARFFALHPWTECHFPWRCTFHNFEKAFSHPRYTSPLGMKISAWQVMADEHILPLCREPIAIRYGSWTIYFQAKLDVAKVRLMFASEVESVQTLKEHILHEGHVVHQRLNTWKFH